MSPYLDKLNEKGHRVLVTGKDGEVQITLFTGSVAATMTLTKDDFGLFEEVLVEAKFASGIAKWPGRR